MIATTLFNDLMRAKKLFIEKRDAFKALLDVYRERVPIWNQKDRTLRIVRNKEVQCVYRQNQAKSRFLLSDGFASHYLDFQSLLRHGYTRQS